ncbi:polysaccharide deacetylase family protein [Microbacter sp. ANSKLAB05]|nr:polysaccharide deacetylase family protein [Microbacter sp. ANSKLAB05]
MIQTLPVLLYHSVTDSPTPGFEKFTVHPHQFESHLDCLLEDDRLVMSLGEIAAHMRSGTPLPEGAMAVTFDDGLADFARHAWPRLRVRAMPTTLYPVAGLIGDRSSWLPGEAGRMRMLTADELSELADDGVEIGAHSMTHPQLDLVPLARARQEIVESKDVLEQMLGRPVTTFAYPHGHHTRAVKELVAEAGYRSAAAVRDMFSHERDDVFAIARLTVTGAATTADVGRLLQGRGARRAPHRQLLRTRVGRTVRRLRHRSEAIR